MASALNVVTGGLGGLLSGLWPTLIDDPEGWCNGDPLKTGRLGYSLGIASSGMIASVYVGTIRHGIPGDWGLSQMLGLGGATLGLNLLCKQIYPMVENPLLKVALTVFLPSVTAAAGNVLGFNFHVELDKYWMNKVKENRETSAKANSMALSEQSRPAFVP